MGFGRPDDTRAFLCVHDRSLLSLSTPPVSLKMDDAGRNPSVESLLSTDDRTPFMAANNLPPETDSHPNLIVLVPDDEDDIDVPFYFSDGDDEEEDEYDAAQLDWLASSATPLFTPLVYLYLLSPFLGLGAMFIPDGNVSRPRTIAAVCVFIILSTFARYIWYLLARYLRKIHLEDIVADAFAKGRTKQRLRVKLRSAVRLGDWVSKVLLAAVYLRGQCATVNSLIININASQSPSASFSRWHQKGTWYPPGSFGPQSSYSGCFRSRLPPPLPQSVPLSRRSSP